MRPFKFQLARRYGQLGVRLTCCVDSASVKAVAPGIRLIGEGGQDWPAVAAATTLFLIPIFVFTILLRKHLLRGITFGAVRK